jgi:hypothetical protein
MCVTIALSDAADSNWYTLAALGRTTLCMESTGQSETKRKRCAKCLNHEWETHKTRHYENQNFPNVAVPDVSRITATRVDGGEVNMAWPAGEVDKVLFIQYNTDLVDAREAEDRKSYGHNVADSSVPCIAVLSTSVSVRARRAMLDVRRVVPTEHVPGVARIQRTEGYAFLAIARKHDFHGP